MQDIVNLLVNNGVAVAVVCYFMWRDFKYMSKIDSTLDLIKELIKKEVKNDTNTD